MTRKRRIRLSTSPHNTPHLTSYFEFGVSMTILCSTFHRLAIYLPPAYSELYVDLLGEPQNDRGSNGVADFSLWLLPYIQFLALLGFFPAPFIVVAPQSQMDGSP
jgi:hypothetical protein